MTETKKAHVLVTGAGGFIGGFLCERLVADSHAVTALAMPNENTDRLENLGCRIVRGDLTRSDTISGIFRGADLVFHLAARVTYWGTRNDFYSAIVDHLQQREVCHEAEILDSVFSFHHPHPDHHVLHVGNPCLATLSPRRTQGRHRAFHHVVFCRCNLFQWDTCGSKRTGNKKTAR